MFRIFSFLAIAIIAGLLGAFWFFRVPIFEKTLSKALDAEVLIQNVHLGWGSATLLDTKIRKEPIGDFLRADEIAISFDLTTLFKSRIHIDELRIANVELKKGLNLNLPRENRSSAIALERVKIVNLSELNGKQTLPYLEWYGIGLRETLSLSELSGELFARMSKSLEKGSPASRKLIVDKEQLTTEQLTHWYQKAKRGSMASYEWLKEKAKGASKSAVEYFQTP